MNTERNINQIHAAMQNLIIWAEKMVCLKYHFSEGARKRDEEVFRPLVREWLAKDKDWKRLESMSDAHLPEMYAAMQRERVVDSEARQAALHVVELSDYEAELWRKMQVWRSAHARNGKGRM